MREKTDAVDLIVLCGALLVLVGVACFDWRVALILAGLLLVGGGLWASHVQARAAVRRQEANRAPMTGV
jgi:hypothetical protein